MEQLDFESILKKHHLRLTRTRQALWTVFSKRRTPLSVAQLLAALACHDVRVNKTTVYRELERLETIGVVTSVRLQDRKEYFELALRHHHHHFVCIGCATVEDIFFDETDLSLQEARLVQKNGFSILRHSLELFGLCKTCS